MPAHHAKTPLLVVANARYSPSYQCALRLLTCCSDPLEILIASEHRVRMNFTLGAIVLHRAPTNR